MASSKAHHLTSVTAKPTSVPRNTMLKLHCSIAQSIGAVSRHRGRRKLNPNQTLLIFKCLQCLLQVLIRVPVNLPSPTWRASSSSHSSWSSSLIPKLAGSKPRPKPKSRRRNLLPLLAWKLSLAGAEAHLAGANFHRCNIRSLSAE